MTGLAAAIGSALCAVAPGTAGAQPVAAAAPAIAAGGSHVLALRADGTVLSFGANARGQLGRAGGDSATPTDLGAILVVSAVAAGDEHSLLVGNDGTVSAFGTNEHGQLGSATNLGLNTANPTPTAVAGLTDVVDAAAGGFHSVVLHGDGTVSAFGDNFFGQLGSATNNATSTPIETPTVIAGLTDIVDIEAGNHFTMALRADGTVWTFGRNTDGQLGNSTNLGNNNANPTPYAALDDVAAIAAGGAFALALRNDGTVWGWGDNDFGQLGTTAGPPITVPAQIAGLDHVRAIAAGAEHVLAVRTDGTVWGLGSDASGQLGGGGTTATPVQLTGPSGVAAVAAGTDFSIVRADAGTVWGFGSDVFGQIGGATPGSPAIAGLTLERTIPADSAARLLDTRPGGVTVDGVGQGGGAVTNGSTTEIVVAGRSGVHADAAAAVLNVTVTAPTGPGFLTVYPCDAATRPLASNLNYVAGQTVANLAISGLSGSGKVCVYNEGASTQLIVDVDRFYEPGFGFGAAAPARYLDTRTGFPTIDGAGAGGGAATSGSNTEVVVVGRGSVPVPATTKAVVLNLTVTAPTANGFATVYPCDEPRPLASNINYRAGQTVANLAVAKLSADGKVCVYNEGATAQLIVDVAGEYGDGAAYWPVSPERLLDTRTGGVTVDGTGVAGGSKASGTVTEVRITGRGSLPFNAELAVLNVTATDANGTGFVTAYPCGAARPLASNLNYAAGRTVANSVITQIGEGGKVCLYNEGATTQLVVDVNGYTVP